VKSEWATACALMVSARSRPMRSENRILVVGRYNGNERVDDSFQYSTRRGDSRNFGMVGLGPFDQSGRGGHLNHLRHIAGAQFGHHGLAIAAHGMDFQM
jgi:hypothetical protein